MNEPSDRDVEVFTEALQLAVGDRPAYLERACSGDADLRHRVEALLASHERVGDFLEHSPHETADQIKREAMIGEKPGDHVGRYKLLQQIGEGGCGVVFMAEQEEPVRRRVALKIIKPGMDTKSVIARFEAERQALALMDHPNIAKIFDAGATESGRPYFVMELVRGIKITEYCDQHELTTRERLEIFVQVCRAIQHAHQKGIIHRDIKPSNILVTQSVEGSTLPVVIDFGIAKATTNQKLTDKTLFTAFEMLIGTPAYMSPEQAVLTSADVDTRTDIYSLGVLLYELLTGSTPFDSGALLKSGLDEIRRVIREQEPARPSTRLSKMTGADLTTVAQRRKSEAPTLIHVVRGDLDWITMKALEKDRTRRYETAYGMALDIQRYLANEPILARPPSRFYQLRKTFLRNRFSFIGVGIIALLLVASLIVVSKSLATERQARREAEAASIKSQQTTRFLEDMLQGVEPSAARGRDTKMLQEILDRTAQRVGAGLTNQPGVETAMRSFIGELYVDIGGYQDAEKMYDAAVAINRELFGSESKETAESLSKLGLAFDKEGKFREAESADRESLRIRRKLSGNESESAAEALNALASRLRHQNRLTEAESAAREGLEIRQRLCKGDSLDVADSLRNLSIILGDEGRGVDAESTAREMLAMRRHLLGSNDLQVASALNDVAWAAGINGKTAEAISLQREALGIQRNLLGEENTSVAKTLAALGERTRQTDLKESDSLLRAALAIQSKLSGEDNPDYLHTLESLGTTLDAEGNWAEAETTHRKEAGLWRKMEGDDDPHVLRALNNLSSALQSQNKWAEAETVRRDALAVWRKRAGSEDRSTLFAYRDLGLTLENEGKWQEAEGIWRESLVVWRKLGGNEEKESMYTLRKLGLAFEAEHKWPEAEAIHREALSISRKKGDDDPEALADLEKLVRVLTNEKKYPEAKELLDKAFAPGFVAQGASANLLNERVDFLGRRGQWKEAAVVAAIALEKQPDDHYRYHILAALLAMTQDRPSWEQVCKKLASRFVNPTDPYIAERVAQDCMLLPKSPVDLAWVDKLADTAVTRGSGEGSLPYFQACKAMSNYRLGRFGEAVEWAEKTVNTPNAEAPAKGKAFAVLAMGRWQLGQASEARVALASGNAVAPKLSAAHDDLGGLWMAWLMARVSLDEAGALIQSVSAPGPRR